MITRLVHNVETGKISEVSVDAKEIELNALQKQKYAEQEAEAQAKRETALSKLAALGLTADDLQALGL